MEIPDGRIGRGNKELGRFMVFRLQVFRLHGRRLGDPVPMVLVLAEAFEEDVGHTVP